MKNNTKPRYIPKFLQILKQQSQKTSRPKPSILKKLGYIKILNLSFFKFFFIVLLALFQLGCGKSKESVYYVLNPISYKKLNQHQYAHLRIGINEIDCPSYICKPDLVIHYAPHRVELKDNNQWAGSLNLNIKRIIEANLTQLLPGAAVLTFPWSSNFSPIYHLQLNIIQFDVDIRGCSNLRVNYYIYNDQKLIKNGSLYYTLRVQPPTLAHLVDSMNANINHLSRDLANLFKSLPRVENNSNSHVIPSPVATVSLENTSTKTSSQPTVSDGNYKK